VKGKKTVALFFSLFFLFGGSLASGNELSEVYAKKCEEDVVKKEFTQVFPKMRGKIKSIKKVDADEIYEIVLNNDFIFYYLRTGNGQKKYIMMGSLLDTKGNNLTSERRSEILNAHADEYYNLVKKYAPYNAVKIGNGKEAVFYVFIDSDCPHCRRIFRYLTSSKDRFTSYFFLIGLTGMSRDKARFVLCHFGEKGYEKRLIDVMNGFYDGYDTKTMNKLLKACPEREAMKRILWENRELAEKVKLTGTPHIIMVPKDGKARVIRGANIPLIEKFLKEKKDE